MGCGVSCQASCGTHGDVYSPNAPIQRRASKPLQQWTEKPMQKWTQEDVSDWLATLPYETYRPLLVADGEAVTVHPFVWSDELLASVGVTSRAQRRQLIAERDEAAQQGAGGRLSRRSAPSAARVPKAAPDPSDDSGSEEDAPPPPVIKPKKAAARAVPAAEEDEPVAEAAPAAGPSGQAAPRRHAAGKTSSSAPASVAAARASDAKAPEASAEAEAAAAKKKKFMGYLLKGASVAKQILEQVGPTLPFGGDKAAELLVRLIGMVEDSIENKEKLILLRDRTVELLDLILDNQANFQDSQFMRKIISRFTDLLEMTIKYAEDYATRNWLMRIVTSSGDGAHYEDLEKELSTLTRETTAAVVIDAHGMTKEVRDHVRATEDRKQRVGALLRPYTQDGKVDVEALRGDEPALKAIMKKLDPSESLTLSMMHQALLTLQAQQEEGCHKEIQHPTLRVFWRRLFRFHFCIPWARFWSIFPGELSRDEMSEQEAQKIKDLLADQAARRAFQSMVEKDEPDHVSVQELKLSFPAGPQLYDRIKELVDAAAAAEQVSARRCDIPQPDAVYFGRDGVAANLASSLISGKFAPPLDGAEGGATVLCVVASAGYGKSALALDVAWRLWKNKEAAGVLLVNMREVRTRHAVHQAFCAALRVEPDAKDSTPKILLRLQTLVADAAMRPGEVLVVMVDNAEDPLADKEAADFTALLQKIQEGVPEARVLVTSREAFPDAGSGRSGRLKVHHHHLSALLQQDAEQVVHSLVNAAAAAQPSFSRDEVAQVAAVCGGVPLVLRLMADALKSGRLEMADVRAAMATSCADQDMKVLTVLLTALPKAQLTALAQLACFPTTFSDLGAAAALMYEVPRAQGVLKVLVGHGLVRYNGHDGSYSLHARVQQAASGGGVLARAGGDLGATREACAVHCVENLARWTQIYTSGGMAVTHALQQGRQHQADIKLLLQAMGRSPEVPERVARALVDAATPALGRYLYPLGLMGLPEMVQTWRNVSAFYKPRDELLHATALSMLAWCLRAVSYNVTEGHAESEELFHKVIEIRTRLLGEDHLETATAKSSLGSSLAMQGRGAEAEPLFREVLELRTRRQAGDITEAMANLAYALTLCKPPRLAEAEPLQHQVLARRGEAQGPEHPDTLTALRALAGCILDLGRAAEAEPLLQRALVLRSKVLGADHADTVTVVGLLARCVASLERFAEAAELYGRAASGWQRLYGPEAKAVKDCVAAQAACKEKLGSAATGV